MRKEINDQELSYWLSLQIETFGLTEDWFESLGYKPATVRQYRKAAVKKPADLYDKVSKGIESSVDALRKQVRSRNEAQFSNVPLSIYHNLMSTVELRKMPGSNYSFTPAQDHLPTPGDGSISQKEWIELQLSSARANRSRDTFSHAIGRNVVAIMGSPGSGKTTELKRLLLEFQDDRKINELCLFIPLSVYGFNSKYSNDPNVMASGSSRVTKGVFSIAEAAHRFYVGRLGLQTEIDFVKFIEHEANAGRVIFFLDSLDEAPSTVRHDILRLISNIKECKVFLTSRYVQPRLDARNGQFTASTIWHLAGLEREGIVSHLAAISAGLDERIGGAEKQIVQSLRTFIDLLESDGDSSGLRFLLMRLPIYLNLAVGLTIDRGPDIFDEKELVSRYVTFLLSTWAGARSEMPFASDTNTELLRMLGYLAFDLTMRECMNIDPPNPEEAQELVTDYFSHGAISRTKDELKDLVFEVFERARTAQLISSEDGNYLRFGNPGDVLREFLLSEFISQATNYGMSPLAQEAAGLSQSKAEAALTEATFEQFLINPNLRFLHRGQALFIRGQDRNHRVNDRYVGYLLNTAYRSTPMDLTAYGISKPDTRRILPVNLMLVASSLPRDRLGHYSVCDKVAEEIFDIYDHTNFEKVFDALSPICGSMKRPSGMRTNALSKLDHPDFLDRAWRRATTVEALRIVEEQATNCLSAGKISGEFHGKILRRIAYKARYCVIENMDSALEWLIDLRRRSEIENYRSSEIIKYTLLDSVRSIGDPLEKGYFREFYSDSVRSKEFEERLNNSLQDAWEDASFRNSSDPVPYLVNEIVTNSRDFSLDLVGRQYANWDLAYRRPFKADSIVKKIYDLATSDLDRASSIKLLMVIAKLSEHFDIRQALMPENHRLPFWHREPRFLPSSEFQRPILVCIAEGLKEGIPRPQGAGVEDGAALEQDDDAEEAGLLRKYDYALEAFWKIFAHGTDG